MTCNEFEELSGAYVLDAVTPAERQAAQAHLATCPKCTRLVQELNAAASLLPLATPQVTPSPSLKEQVMQAIRSTPQESRRAPIPLRPPLRPPALQRSRRAGWTTRLLAIAALLLLMISGGMTAWNISLQHQVSTVQASNAQLSSQLRALQQTNAAQANQITSLSHRVARVYTITGTKPAQNASGSLLYLPQQNLTVLVLYNLPKLQGTQIYQGWLLRNNAPVSIGVLSLQNGIASLTYPGSVSSYDSAAVSQEPGPRPSAPAPSGKIVASASLHHSTLVEFTI